jgi:prepilin-type N-terminal cleavage/methylation domain-containing protein
MKITGPKSHRSQAGFSLLELVLVVAILTIVLAAVFNGINTATMRSQAEQTKVDLTQEGREFVDEFERDLHQAGYPNCRMTATVVLGIPYNCPLPTDIGYLANEAAVVANPKVAVGLRHVESSEVVFEGDVDGSGTVSTVTYQLVDSAGHWPPAGTCPCKIQRSQVAKGQPASWSLELQNVVNSGQSTTAGVLSGGLQIAGNTAWGQSDTAYYAAISSFKDFPVFQAYDQTGAIVQLPQDISTSTVLSCTVASVTCIKSIRLTINLLANETTGVDLKTNVRPVTTLVGDARLVNTAW